MHCPLCQHQANTVMRTTSRGNQIRRTRQCDRCGNRWVTVEIDEAQALMAERIRAKAGELMAAIGAV